MTVPSTQAAEEPTTAHSSLTNPNASAKNPKKMTIIPLNPDLTETLKKWLQNAPQDLLKSLKLQPITISPWMSPTSPATTVRTRILPKDPEIKK